MEKGRLKLGGWMGKTGWAFIHVLYLGRAEGQLMLCLQWLFGVLFRQNGFALHRYTVAGASGRGSANNRGETG